MPTAGLLASDGYAVFAGDRGTSYSDLVTKHTSLKNFHLINLDVTDQQSVDLAVKKIIDNEGRLDILVNNARIMVYGSVENVTIEDAQKVFDVNFFGVMRITQAVLPIIRERRVSYSN